MAKFTRDTAELINITELEDNTLLNNLTVESKKRLLKKLKERLNNEWIYITNCFWWLNGLSDNWWMDNTTIKEKD